MGYHSGGSSKYPSGYSYYSSGYSSRETPSRRSSGYGEDSGYSSGDVPSRRFSRYGEPPRPSYSSRESTPSHHPNEPTTSSYFKNSLSRPSYSGWSTHTNHPLEPTATSNYFNEPPRTRYPAESIRTIHPNEAFTSTSSYGRPSSRSNYTTHETSSRAFADPPTSRRSSSRGPPTSRRSSSRNPPSLTPPSSSTPSVEKTHRSTSPISESSIPEYYEIRRALDGGEGFHRRRRSSMERVAPVSMPPPPGGARYPKAHENRERHYIVRNGDTLIEWPVDYQEADYGKYPDGNYVQNSDGKVVPPEIPLTELEEALSKEEQKQIKRRNKKYRHDNVRDPGFVRTITNQNRDLYGVSWHPEGNPRDFERASEIYKGGRIRHYPKSGYQDGPNGPFWDFGE